LCITCTLIFGKENAKNQVFVKTYFEINKIQEMENMVLKLGHMFKKTV
jgi:hypothetical protein